MESNYIPFDYEVQVAANKVAELRFLESRRLNLAQKNYSKNYIDLMQKDALGTMAEIVVGRLFDVTYFPSINTFHKKADVGQDIEVRSTDLEDGGLIVRANDDENRRFVLVVVDRNKGYIIKGWAYGYEVKQKGWFWKGEPEKDKCDAWCYRGALRPMEELF